jgi:ERCC4-type nuclease
MKEKPVLLIDTREKQPYDFEPDDAFGSIRFIKLDAGDYTLEGLEKIVIVERKASVDELFINFTKDKDRIKAEFERLKDHKFKILMLEFSCEDMMNPSKYYINRRGINKQHPKMPVAVVAEGITKLMMEYGVHVIFGGSRAQTMTRGLLLKAYELHGKGLL